jgi:hypothetical protein
MNIIYKSLGFFVLHTIFYVYNESKRIENRKEYLKDIGSASGYFFSPSQITMWNLKYRPKNTSELLEDD